VATSPSEIWLQNVGAQSKALEPGAPAGGKFSAPLFQRIDEHNFIVGCKGPTVETAPLPARGQFLNVIESIFSGMSRAIIQTVTISRWMTQKPRLTGTSVSATPTSKIIRGGLARRYGEGTWTGQILGIQQLRRSAVSLVPSPLKRLTASNTTQCWSRPVSRSRLPKTGIFHTRAGDYRRFRAKIVRFGSIETESQFTKSRNWRPQS
jgi:hypothetical protein